MTLTTLSPPMIAHHTKTSTAAAACPRRRRGVTFSTVAAVRSTISRNDFLPKEIQAAWFTAKEYASIQASCIKQINKIDNGKKLKDKKYCSRGLEGHTKLGRITRSQNRAQAIQAVLDEQELQLNENVVDDIALAYVYQQTTSSCQMWASVTGLLDQREAEDDITSSADEDETKATVRSASNYSSSKLSASTSSTARCYGELSPETLQNRVVTARSA